MKMLLIGLNNMLKFAFKNLETLLNSGSLLMNQELLLYQVDRKKIFQFSKVNKTSIKHLI